MKTKTTLFICLCMVSILHLSASVTETIEKIKGDGDIVTRSFTVEDYDKLILAENIEFSNKSAKSTFKKKKKRSCSFTYSQSPGDAFLQITMDRNLFDYLIVDSSNGILRIRAEKDIKIKPTKMNIKGSSRELSKVEIVGCMEFICEGPVNTHSLRTAITGVGDVTFNNLTADEFTCEISGVGNMHLKGSIENGNYYLTGVGKIYAYDCAVENLTCEVSGVGNMEVRANKHLKAGTSGVGGIKYKGPAEVDSWSSGLGKVKDKN